MVKRFHVDFIMIFNWCAAWHIRGQAKTDPSMASAGNPGRITNKIIELTIGKLNSVYYVDKPSPVTRRPVFKSFPAPVNAPIYPFQSVTRHLQLSSSLLTIIISGRSRWRIVGIWGTTS